MNELKDCLNCCKPEYFETNIDLTIITSRKIDRTNELLEELLGLPGSFVCRKDVLEPVADDPLLLGVLLRRRVDQENAKLETEVCRNEI